MPKHRPGYITPQPAPGDDGQQPCRRDGWCASSQIVYDTPDGTGRRVPEYGPRPFCSRDALLVERSLTELPAQYVHLSAELGNPSGRSSSIRVPFGPRVPLRVDVEALMRLISESLTSWHERVAAAASLTFPAGYRRDGYAVQRATDVMAERVAAVIALPPEPMTRSVDIRDLAAFPDDTPGVVHAAFAEIVVDLDGGDAGMEILNLRYLARATLGETRAKPEELVGVPCHDCGWRAVYRAELPSHEDEPVWWTECARCGDRMSEETYREWTALCAAYERNKVKVPATLENLPSVA
jgi:hypothetical protein